MKKAYMLNLENNERMAASDYYIKVTLKSDEVIGLEKTAYSYEDVFEYIQEYFEDKNDESVKRIEINLIR